GHLAALVHAPLLVAPDLAWRAATSDTASTTGSAGHAYRSAPLNGLTSSRWSCPSASHTSSTYTGSGGGSSVATRSAKRQGSPVGVTTSAARRSAVYA